MRIIHVHTCVCICLHLRKTNKTETRSEKNGSTAPLVVRMSTRYLYLKELYYITYTVYFYAFVSLCVQHFVELGECASLPFMLCVCWLAHKYFCNVSRVCQLGENIESCVQGLLIHFRTWLFLIFDFPSQKVLFCSQIALETVRKCVWLYFRLFINPDGASMHFSSFHHLGSWNCRLQF